MKAPLYATGVTAEGKLLVGGIFKMQDEAGVPLDASFEECRQLGYAVDWLEALCDCWLNDPLKFDSFVRQAEQLSQVDLLDMFKASGAITLAQFPEMKAEEWPVNSFCLHVLKQKRK